MHLRERLVKLARLGVDGAEKWLPKGYHAVVVVTDENGDYVGVHATSDHAYTLRILRAALFGSELVHHRGKPL